MIRESHTVENVKSVFEIALRNITFVYRKSLK
jgi:hypothetical protein